MNESIGKQLYKKYKVEVFTRGGWFDKDKKMSRYAFSVCVFGVTLLSNKTYKHCGGAVIAAKKLIKKLEHGDNK